MKVTDYKQLKVWQKGIEIVDKVYSLTDKFPREELYGLTGQMRRAAISIPVEHRRRICPGPSARSTASSSASRWAQRRSWTRN